MILSLSFTVNMILALFQVLVVIATVSFFLSAASNINLLSNLPVRVYFCVSAVPVVVGFFPYISVGSFFQQSMGKQNNILNK